MFLKYTKNEYCVAGWADRHAKKQFDTLKAKDKC
jgi:hypothetical protein